MPQPALKGVRKGVMEGAEGGRRGRRARRVQLATPGKSQDRGAPPLYSVRYSRIRLRRGLLGVLVSNAVLSILSQTFLCVLLAAHMDTPFLQGRTRTRTRVGRAGQAGQAGLMIKERAWRASSRNAQVRHPSFWPSPSARTSVSEPRRSLSLRRGAVASATSRVDEGTREGGADGGCGR